MFCSATGTQKRGTVSVSYVGVRVCAVVRAKALGLRARGGVRTILGGGAPVDLELGLLVGHLRKGLHERRHDRVDGAVDVVRANLDEPGARVS